MDLTTLAAGPVGAILGLGGSLIQKYMGMKEARDNHAMKMEEMEVMSRIDLQKADIMFRQVVEEKSGEAFKAAIDAQAALKPSSPLANDFLALFRPGITLVLLIASTGLALWYHDAKPELLEFVIVSMFTMSNCALGFWFGARADEKQKIQAAFRK